jgi:hypothetical protein
LLHNSYHNYFKGLGPISCFGLIGITHARKMQQKVINCHLLCDMAAICNNFSFKNTLRILFSWLWLNVSAVPDSAVCCSLLTENVFLQVFL